MKHPFLSLSAPAMTVLAVLARFSPAAAPAPPIPPPDKVKHYRAEVARWPACEAGLKERFMLRP